MVNFVVNFVAEGSVFSPRRVFVVVWRYAERGKGPRGEVFFISTTGGHGTSSRWLLGIFRQVSPVGRSETNYDRCWKACSPSDLARVWVEGTGQDQAPFDM